MKLIQLDPSTDVPNPDKVQVFDIAKMVAFWGSDKTYTCLTPLKWQEATKNLLAALLLLCETLSPVEELTHHTFAGEFEKHRKFFIHYLDLKETYRTGILLSMVNGYMHAKEAAALMIPPSNPLKRTSDSDLHLQNKVGRNLNDSPGSSQPDGKTGLRNTSSSLLCLSCCSLHIFCFVITQLAHPHLQMENCVSHQHAKVCFGQQNLYGAENNRFALTTTSQRAVKVPMMTDGFTFVVYVARTMQLCLVPHHAVRF
ncbi:hypothetical protein BT96DRAFT_996958 [Gymnopus androsaceus JB14]|uniref:Uncharacterized protein n=1 Tax=Gymnopus androsaceus JB14 TaxID=1447944 RepID=A0A6A4HEI3_9AGAR|nr:hypothetical protein BT96DRAFT_996958 [Gymnopus androsaceus JB14]